VVPRFPGWPVLAPFLLGLVTNVVQPPKIEIFMYGFCYYCALSNENKIFIASQYDNPFVYAVHIAYCKHIPLVISPDMIWYLVITGVSRHILKNSQKLRDKFVDFDGKKKIEIRRDDFVLNSQSNPWNEVIEEFCFKINEFTKNGIADKFIAKFSTTTSVSTVVNQIVLMSSMQYYFDYHLSTMCGIPKINIDGSKEDWEMIKIKANKFLELIPDLKLWMNHLNEIFQNFIDAFDNKIDKTFWNSLYKVSGGSGGPYVSGWILALFPYLKDNIVNIYAWDKNWKESKGKEDIKSLSFSFNLNQVPFI